MGRVSHDGAGWHIGWRGLDNMVWIGRNGCVRHDCTGMGGHEKAARPRWGKLGTIGWRH